MELIWRRLPQTTNSSIFFRSFKSQPHLPLFTILLSPFHSDKHFLFHSQLKTLIAMSDQGIHHSFFSSGVLKPMLKFWFLWWLFIFCCGVFSCLQKSVKGLQNLLLWVPMKKLWRLCRLWSLDALGLMLAMWGISLTCCLITWR